MTQNPPYFFANKPAKISTHRVNSQQCGFVEYLNKKLSKELLVCHRLDKETSGAIVFAEDKIAANKLMELFSQRKVQKKYLLISHSAGQKGLEFTIQSNISKQGFVYRSDTKCSQSNSITHFTFQKKLGEYYCWEARPETGKTHQIRLHAENAGIPILGDSLYGGQDFPRLLLHASEISFELDQTTFKHKSPSPLFFEDPQLLTNPQLASIETSIERRELLFPLHDPENNTWRIIHNENPDFRCDLINHKLWVYWYRYQPPNQEELKNIEYLSGRTNATEYLIQLMENRGASATSEKIISTFKTSNWIGKENQIAYQFKSDQGFSPGLFLDQRANRLWVKENSRDKDILNLFAYTGGFSLAAAMGGARSITTVDTSIKTLEWAKENFRLNQFSIEELRFLSSDAREFIERAIKRNWCYDLIICDPPSFARSKKGIFKINKEFTKLFASLFSLLNPNGLLLFSLNYEIWNEQNLREQIDHLRLNGLTFITNPDPGWDYELPGIPRILKTIIVKKEVRTATRKK